MLLKYKNSIIHVATNIEPYIGKYLEKKNFD